MGVTVNSKTMTFIKSEVNKESVSGSVQNEK